MDLKRQNFRLLQLFKLIEKYPDLPIVPMVDEEIVCDDNCARWKGSWGNARVDEYAEKNERIYFRGDDDDYDLFCVFFNEDEIADLPEDEQDRIMEEKLKTIPWVRAIVVDIDLPE